MTLTGAKALPGRAGQPGRGLRERCSRSSCQPQPGQLLRRSDPQRAHEFQLEIAQLAGPHARARPPLHLTEEAAVEVAQRALRGRDNARMAPEEQEPRELRSLSDPADVVMHRALDAG